MNNRTASSWLTIDLKALAANYNLFREKVGDKCRVSGVVKANGYGLGIEKVWATLENQDCPSYYVATLDEALKLRGMTRKPIAVLGGLYRGTEDYYVHENITPVLNSLADIADWAKVAAGRSIPLPAIIHFDTAMNRLGLDSVETPQLLEDLSIIGSLQIKAIMTHFACSDDRKENGDLDDITVMQAKRFKDIAKHFPDTPKSLCNSAGVFCDSSYYMDNIRPGMALYGLNPTPHTENPMKNVVGLKARILQVRQALKDETVGYGATYRFDKNSTTATVGLGYADGFLRSLTNKGQMFYKGEACPIVGRVSMDAVTVDITHLENKPKQGDALDVICDQQTADDLARDASTIGYEILTSLGSRYSREYV